MRREYIFIWHLTCFFFFLHFEGLYTKANETGNEYSKGCAHLHCESGSRCIKRRFWCKDPPCPGILYCSKSRKESLKGPLTCDTVRCSRGHICIVRVRGCHWEENCQQQIARCISEKEYYEGAASCAGFNCPSGKRCILRETYCVNPPCKLIKSCAEAEDVEAWFDECKSLNCTSKYECFLRRPENNCLDPWCTHTPDCTLTIEDELVSKYCYGWICPRLQKCSVQIVGSCKGFKCTIERSCRISSISSAKHDMNANDKVTNSARKTLVQIESELERTTNIQTNYPITREKPILAINSTQRQNIRHTTPVKQEAQISLTHQDIVTTESNLITKLLSSSTNKSYLTLPYSRLWLNHNKLSTIDAIDENKILKTTSRFSSRLLTTTSDSSRNLTFPALLPADEKIESTTSRDTKNLEVPKKIYVTIDEVLPFPMVLESINFFGQGYPIWTKNDPFYSLSSNTKDKDDGGWRYQAPQEPYKILLPPYEPVILVEDTKRQGQFFPFFTYTFDYPFNDVALMSLPKITSKELMEDPKTNNIPMIVNDEIDNYVNVFTTVETGNFRMNDFDDMSDNYANVPVMKKTNTVPSNIDKQLNNYYDDWRPYMIHNYPERNEPHQQESKSSIVDIATDDVGISPSRFLSANSAGKGANIVSL